VVSYDTGVNLRCTSTPRRAWSATDALTHMGIGHTKLRFHRSVCAALQQSRHWFGALSVARTCRLRHGHRAASPHRSFGRQESPINRRTRAWTRD